MSVPSSRRPDDVPPSDLCQRWESFAIQQLAADSDPPAIPDQAHLEQARLEQHATSCPRCSPRRSQYRRLVSDLKHLGSEHRPPKHWQQQVREQIQPLPKPATALPPRPLPRRLPWRATLPLLAATLVGCVLGLMLLRSPAPVAPPNPSPAALTLQLRLEEGPAVHRGGPQEELRWAQSGDRLHLEATPGAGTTETGVPDTSGAAPRLELRVYRNERELVLACGGPPQCRLEEGRLRGTVELLLPGRYQALVLASPYPLPAAGAGLDQDTATAISQGAEVELGPSITVQ
ncbi:MAG: hypothetical protein AAGD01_19195 [Acidobacteriota bacterium]